MSTPQFNVLQLDCYPLEAGEANVVFCAHWECTAEDFFGGEPVSGRVYGTVNVTLDDASPFTPYADLTKDQVIGWVKEALGEETVAATEAAVMQQIEDQKNPKVVHPALPWAN